MRLDNQIIDYSLYKGFDLDIFYKHKFLLVKQKALYVVVVSARSDAKIPDEISHYFNKPLKIKKTSRSNIDFELSLLRLKIQMFDIYNQALAHISNKQANSSYISKFCDEVLALALAKNASDIHIENTSKHLGIRFRIHGNLKTFFTYSIELYPMLSSILKLFANLDISINRMPQNGQFSRILKKQSCDFRISTLPTVHGESITIRILTNAKQSDCIDDLNLDAKSVEAIKQSIEQTKGFVLITGSTGSGKTTTLYAILNSLKSKNSKIISIEEPVEYDLDFVSQVNINNDIGLSYDRVLTNVLRQDPDVLMIGEIRDEIALSIALRASLTGHLVLASLHTNSAIQTITRLKDLKAQPFILSSVLSLVMSQILLRILCEHCKKEYTYKSHKVYAPSGCIKCNLSGYSKRIVISEFIKIDDTLSELIATNASSKQIEEYAKKQGYKSFKQIAYEKFLNGETSLQEYSSHLF